MKLQVVTVASDLAHPGLQRLKASAEAGNWPLHVIPVNWGGWGTKMIAVAEWAKNADVDAIFYTDAYDTLFVRPYYRFMFYAMFNVSKETKEGYYGLISGEKNCWPDASLAKMYPSREWNTRWCYVNAGQWLIGKNLFLQMLEENPIRTTDDDQLWLTHRYLSGAYNLRIDMQCNVFQSVAFEEAGEFGDMPEKVFFNEITWRRPFILHGNGRTDLTKFEKYSL